MDLFKKKDGKFLVAVYDENHPVAPMNRLMAEVFPGYGGVLFFDIGWSESDNHFGHLLEGKISKDGKSWTVKNEKYTHRIEEFDPIRHPDLIIDHEKWQYYLSVPDGKKASYKNAVRVYKRFFRRDYMENKDICDKLGI